MEGALDSESGELALALALFSDSVTLSKVLNISEHQQPHLRGGCYASLGGGEDKWGKEWERPCELYGAVQ